MKKIRGYGFDIFYPDGRPFDDVWDFTQINVFCRLK